MRVIDTVREALADVSLWRRASAQNVSYCLPQGVYYPDQHSVDTPVWTQTRRLRQTKCSLDSYNDSFMKTLLDNSSFRSWQPKSQAGRRFLLHSTWSDTHAHGTCSVDWASQVFGSPETVAADWYPCTLLIFWQSRVIRHIYCTTTIVGGSYRKSTNQIARLRAPAGPQNDRDVFLPYRVAKNASVLHVARFSVWHRRKQWRVFMTLFDRD